MHIERATLPPGRGGRPEKYTDLFRAISQTSDWYTVDLSEIGGKTNQAKQATLHTAAATRGLRIQTAARDHKMYVKLRPSEITVNSDSDYQPLT